MVGLVVGHHFRARTMPELLTAILVDAIEDAKRVSQ